SRVSSSAFVICAQERLQRASTTTAVITSEPFDIILRIGVPRLEVEVESQQQTVAGKVGSVWRRSALTDPGVLIMKSETGAAVHEGHVPVSNHIIVKVP